DTYNFAYTFSFNQRESWPDYYSKRHDVYAYMSRTADEIGMCERTLFDTKVESAHYDEDKAEWAVSYRVSDGELITERFNALITATGHLNIPKLPDIPGREKFKGHQVHTARWPRDLDIKNR